ncbi:unnamed protein product [Coffea canephora]|uniref:Uncharacterized protein n=1 Tax=Coffea canephora TaxID=49390 RepID=A0A068UBC6_COFCA|nr:unnamed protein product [Coffea canephora]
MLQVVADSSNGRFAPQLLLNSVDFPVLFLMYSTPELTDHLGQPSHHNPIQSCRALVPFPRLFDIHKS